MKNNFDDVARKIRALGKKGAAQMPPFLRQTGEEIMTDVKASRPGHGVPVDTGALRSSGRVTQPTPLRVLLTFGGAAAPYALVQHERMDYRHNVGEPRYLVRGVQRWRANGSQAWAALRRNLDAAIRRSSGA